MTKKKKSPKQNTQSVIVVPEKQANLKAGSPTQPPDELGFKDGDKKSKKGRDNIWNILGFIAAGITVLGAAVFYLVGWTYISNWYGFFGVSIYQIDMPTYHILVNSVSLILISLVVFLFAMSIDHVFFIIRGARTTYKNKKTGDESQTKPGGTIPIFNLRSVMVIYVFLIVIIMGYYLFCCYRNSSSLRFSDIPEELFWFIAVILSNSILYVKRLDQTQRSNFTSMISGSVIIVSILASSTCLAAFNGIADAAAGIQGAWRIPQVYILSKDPMPVFNDYIDNCDSQGTCWYGAFGLVAENDQTIFLVPWLEENENYFSKYNGLFIIQRNEQITLHIFVPEHQEEGKPLPTLIPSSPTP